MRAQLMRLAAASIVAIVLVGTAAGETWDPALDVPVLINDGAEFIPSTLLTFDADIEPSQRLVTGFSFVGTVTTNPIGAAVLPSWLQMTITAPNGFSYVVGGVSDYDAPWDFTGASGSGTYHHGIGGDEWNGNGLPDFAFDEIPIGGTWQFSFLQQRYIGQWARWSDVTVTLHSIPEPATLGLLLVAGLFIRRR